MERTGRVIPYEVRTGLFLLACWLFAWIVLAMAARLERRVRTRRILRRY